MPRPSHLRRQPARWECWYLLLLQRDKLDPQIAMGVGQRAAVLPEGLLAPIYGSLYRQPDNRPCVNMQWLSKPMQSSKNRLGNPQQVQPESCFAALENRFPEELKLLASLFSGNSVTDRLPRLNTIFRFTEQKWSEYVRQIPGGRVKYLLVAEAPPGTDDDPPLYFLDPGCPPRSLMRAVSPAFFGCMLGDGRQALSRLAQEGFLMADSIPFAMNSVRLNAEAVIAGLGKVLRIGDLTLQLSKEMIAIDPSNYPNRKVLRKVFGLAE